MTQRVIFDYGAMIPRILSKVNDIGLAPSTTHIEANINNFINNLFTHSKTVNYSLICIDNAHILWYNEYTKHEEVILWQQLI